MAGGGLYNLIISIAGDISKLQESMTRAEYLTEQTSKKIEAAMATAEKSIKALAAGYVSFKAIDAFADSIDASIKATAELHRMAEQTGTTAEMLSSFRSVAKLSHTDLGQVAMGLSRLSKNMLETAQGTGKSALAFKALGFDVRDSTGHLKGADDAMIELAKKLSKLDNETERTALAMKVFKDPGLVNFLLELARTQQLEAKVTNEQAAAAEHYEQTLIKLTSAKKGMYNVIAQQVVPVMDALAMTMLELGKQFTDMPKKLSADNTIRTWAMNAAVAFTTFLDKVIDVGRGFAIVFQGIGQALAVVGIFFTEVFDNISFAIVHAGDVFQSFGKMAAGQALILAGQWQRGFDLMQEGWKEMGSDVSMFSDKLKSSWTNVSSAVGGLVANMEDSLQGFVKSDVTGILLNKVQDLAVGFHKVNEEGKTHANIVQKLVHDSYDALIAQLTKTGAKLQEELRFMREHGYATDQTEEAVTRAALAEGKMQEVLKERADRERTTVQALMDKAIAQALANDQTNHALKLETEYSALVKSENEALGSMIYNLNQEVATYGGLASSVSTYKMALLQAQRAEALAGSTVAKDLDYQIEQWQKIIKLQQDLEGMKNFVSAVNEAANAVGDVAKAFTESWSKGIDTARDKFRSWWQEIVALVAKKLVLNFVANMVGGPAGAALSNSASLLGSGSVAGSVVNAAGSYFGLGSTGATAAGEGVFAGGTIEGVAGNSLLSSAGGMIAQAIPVLGWIAAAYTLWQTFKDKGENWQATLGFGAHAQAYTTEGVFGREGFESIQGNDSVNRSIQAFMAQSGAIDHIIAATLSAQQISTITANLAGPYTTRNDGQPAQFAFGKDDNTAPAQLTLEYLQKKYGTVFDEIDSTFAQYIRSFTGDSGELMQAIGEFAGVMSALQDSPVPGLDIDALRAMQREGEKLSDTFNNVTKAWGTYVDLFYTDAEKHAMSLQMVQKQFEALGVAMPTTREAFRALVESVDQNSPLWRALIELAPAFSDLVPAVDQVSSAVTTATEAIVQNAVTIGNVFAQAATTFDTIKGSITSLFSGEDLASAMPGEISAVQGYIDSYTRAWTEAISRGDFTGAQGIMQVITQLTEWQSSLRGDLAKFLSLEADHPGKGQALLDLDSWHNQMVSMFSGNAQAMLEIERIYGNRRRAILEGSATDTTSAMEDAFSKARASIREFLAGLNTSEEFSTLLPGQRFDAMGSDLMSAATAAATDPATLSKLPGMAQAYLQMARTLFASGPGYNIALDFIENLLGPLGVDITTAPAATQVSDAASGETRDAVRDLIAVISSGLTVSDPDAQEALGRILIKLDERSTSEGLIS